MLGVMNLFLAGCATRYTPIKPVPMPPDLPDASLVQPCDVTNVDTPTNGALAIELVHARRQRDDCAAKVDAIRQWRTDASARADAAVKAAGAAAPAAPKDK